VNLVNSYPDPLIECNSEKLYFPSDDTYLIIDYFKDHIDHNYFDGKNISDINNILEIGTGTGIIAIYLQLLKEKYPKFTANIFASDIMDEAIECAKKNEKLNKIDPQITFIKSDLFDSFPNNLKHTFDIIIFNPPYLPSSKIMDKENQREKDLTWKGGKKGFELILRLLDEISEYIRKDTTSYIYFITSSATNLRELEDQIRKRGYNLELLDKKHIFFEDILLNRIIY